MSPETDSVVALELSRQIHEHVLAIRAELAQVMKDKADKVEVIMLAQRADKTDDRTRHLEVKQVGISLLVAPVVLWFKAHIIGN